MRRDVKIIFIVLLSLTISEALQAQNPLFGFVNERSIQLNKDFQKRELIPLKYRTVKLNNAELVKFLNLLPDEKNVSNRSATPVLELPMPDGTTALFHVWQSSIMEPGLQKKFPDIRTFAGQGITDPAASIRFDYNPYFGFHAQILSATTGRIFIDPYARGDINHHISFFAKDHLKTNNFICLTEAEITTGKEQRIDFPGNCRGLQLYTYRLAVAATGEYTQAVGGGTVAGAMAAIVTAMNRVNGVYETEVAIRMVLVANNDLVVYTNGATDPYTNSNGVTMLGQNTTNLNLVIGSANYDIGHVFSTGGGGVATLNSPCTASKARGVTGLPNPIGDPFYIDYVAHEMGHQWGGNHTFNGVTGSCSGGNRNGSTAYEVGSGTTIQAYAGICGTDNLQPNSDPIFHTLSIDEISNFVNFGSGAGCAVNTPTGNTLPVITAMNNNGAFIPISTPFTLSGTASDANNDILTYCWEQWDLGPGTAWNGGNANTTSPLFKSRIPKTTGSRTFPDMNVILAGYPANPAADMGGLKGEILPTVERALKFRLTVRDNRAGGGGVVTGGEGCQVGMTSTFQINTVATVGPFAVTSPNGGENLSSGILIPITWNVVGTNNAPINCANVKISLSTDGGLTYPTVLAASTPNDGTENLLLPVMASTTARIKIEAADNIFFDISNANFTILAPNGVWTGITSTDWNTNTNWSNNVLPTATDNATIPVVPNKPVLPANVAINNIDIAAGMFVDLNGQQFTINGVISGAGTLKGSATSDLVFAGAAAGSAGTVLFDNMANSLERLVINRTGAGAAVTMGNLVNIVDVLEVQSGTLNSAGNVVLRSTVSNTARVAPVTGSISGAVTVERFIPARRAWRLLAAPVGGTSEAASGESSLTHAQETTQGILTTTGGDPRPLSFGTASFSLNAAHSAMTFTATINNIDVTGAQTPDPNDNLTAAHIHVGAFPGANAPVRWGFFGAPINDNNPNQLIVTPFPAGVGGTFSSTWDLPEGNAGTTLATNLPGILSGMSYINFHTVQFAGGEIRGQINLVGAGTQTINQAWQEAATTASPVPNPFPGFGTHITQGGAVAGLDFNTAAGATGSLKRYNNATNTWNIVNNTATPAVNSDAWFIFVRGDRSISMSFNNVPANNTTLRSRGPLKVGDQVYPVFATNLTPVANPFASPINFATITRTNVNNSFWLVDPKMGTTGAFVTLTYNPVTMVYDIAPATFVSPNSQYIQSGQGFLVSSTGGGASSITIKETDKSATPATNVFRQNNAGMKSVRINLQRVGEDNTDVLLDGVLATYNPAFSRKVDEMDAVKAENPFENLAIVTAGEALMVERRDVVKLGDVIQLKMWNLDAGAYSFDISTINLAGEGMPVYLVDNYLKTSTALSLETNTTVAFTISSDVASKNAERFSVVFGKVNLPYLNPGKDGFTVYPNPVTEQRFNIQFADKPAGTYQVQIVDQSGRAVMVQTVKHVGGNFTYSMDLGKRYGKGLYQVKISNGKEVSVVPAIVFH